MENLIVTATLTEGGEITLPRPLWIRLEQDVNKPAGSLKLTYPYSAEIPELSRLTLSGEITFSGIVDSILREESENGRLIVVNCRSMAALLLDNHAPPMELASPTPATVLAVYCANMGFNGFLYDEYHAVPSVSATRGTSCWDAVEAFCEQAFGRPPHVTDDNYISALPYGDSRIHSFGKSGYKISSIERVIDRTEVLSGATIRDEEGNYSISVRNNDCPSGVLRYRYIIPEAPWLYYRELLGRRTLRRSMAGYRAIKLTTPNAIDAKIGDRAVLFEEGDSTVWRIAKSTLTIDQNGAQTTLTLHDSRFFE